MKQNHLMKHNLAGFILMAALSLVFIAASGSIYQLLRGPVTVNQPEFPLKDGQYSYDSEFDSKGFYNHVELTVETASSLPAAGTASARTALANSSSLWTVCTS